MFDSKIALASTYEHYFVFPGCTVLFLRARRHKVKDMIKKVSTILEKALFSCAVGIFGVYKYSEFIGATYIDT